MRGRPSCYRPRYRVSPKESTPARPNVVHPVETEPPGPPVALAPTERETPAPGTPFAGRGRVLTLRPETIMDIRKPDQDNRKRDEESQADLAERHAAAAPPTSGTGKGGKPKINATGTPEVV